jgi:hypothetical protein
MVANILTKGLLINKHAYENSDIQNTWGSFLVYFEGNVYTKVMLLQKQEGLFWDELPIAHLTGDLSLITIL